MAKPDVAIRKAGTADIPLIQEIAYKTWPVTFQNILTAAQIIYMLDLMYSSESLQDQMLHKNHQFLLASNSEEYSGFSSYQVVSSSTIKIHKIYVNPEAQGKGIGASLFRYIELLAEQLHVSKVTLNVNINNQAISFYQARGYQTIRQEDIQIGNGYLMEDYVMEKKIS